MIDTLIVAEAVIQQLKKDFPLISALFIKTDNAGCYHSSKTVEALVHTCNQINVSIERYDFSEPQHGKDACDREAAYIKS